MTKEQYSLNDRKRLMMMLMEHRKVDVNDFSALVFAELETWGEWDSEKSSLFRRWTQDLRDKLDDIDHAMIDVVLATDLLDARSILNGFHVQVK
jgi:hypothetical protein